MTTIYLGQVNWPEVFEIDTDRSPEFVTPHRMEQAYADSDVSRHSMSIYSLTISILTLDSANPYA